MGENRFCLIPDESYPVSGLRPSICCFQEDGKIGQSRQLSLWEAFMERSRLPCSLRAQDSVQVSLVSPDGISMAS